MRTGRSDRIVAIEAPLLLLMFSTTQGTLDSWPISFTFAVRRAPANTKRKQEWWDAMSDEPLPASPAGEYPAELERYRKYLHVLAGIQLRDRHHGKLDASDVVQQAMLEAHRSRERFHGGN